jgi:Ca2+-binding EF-hand superfamily protein
MTVSSNYANAYSSYTSSATSSTKQTDRPSFEDLAKELLTSMDTDSSGTIDSAEFSAAAQALASSSSSSDSSTSSSSTTNSSSITDAFNALDSNSDGSLSTDELMAALEKSKPQGKEGGMPPPPPDGAPPPPPPSDSSSASSSTSSSSDIFSALDTNQDGSISADELAALFSDTANSSETASTSTSTASSSQKLSDIMLKNILSYYGNNTSSTGTTSLLSISA